MTKLSNTSCHSIPALAAALLVIGACGGPDLSEENQFAASRDEPVGSGTDIRPWAEGPWLETTLEATSGDDLLLPGALNLDVDSQGRAYLADYASKEIFVLSPDLSRDRALGGEGEGPGEFEVLNYVHVFRGDSLSAWDPRLYRLTVFAPEGREPAYVYDFDSQQGYQGRIGDIWRTRADGGFLVMNIVPYMASGSDMGQERVNTLRHIYEQDGGPADDTILTFAPGESIVARRFDWRGGGAVSIAGHPYGRTSFERFAAGNRVVYANSMTFDVTIVDLEDGARTGFSYDTSPIGVTTAELDAHAAEMGDPFTRPFLEGAPYVWPPLTGLAVDDEGRIWVGIRKEDRTKWEWAAFSPDGSHVASVELPAGFEVEAVRDGRLVGFAEDELGVPEVRAYRVVSEPSS